MATKNIVFIRPPKVGGSSIAYALQLKGHRYARHLRLIDKVEGWVVFGHMHYPTLVEKGLIDEEFDRTSFKFTFVRNPYDRIVSTFFYYKQWWLKGRSGLRRRWESKFETLLDFCRFLDSKPFPPLGAYSMTHDKNHMQSGYNPQVKWTDGVALDFIGKYERIDRDFRKLCRRIDHPIVELPRLRTTNHDHYDTYYCQESRDIVNRIYREDFERFDYTIHHG